MQYRTTMSFRSSLLGAGSVNRHRPSAFAEPSDGAIDRGVWMVASRRDSKHFISIDFDGHCAGDALGVRLVLGPAQGQPSASDPAGVDHLRQRSEQAVLRIGTGLRTDGVLTEDLDLHGCTIPPAIRESGS